jgi:DNA-binding transcriptional LysR family regulator
VAHLASTRLGPARLWTVAAPAYLEQRSAPRSLSDLDAHDCLTVVPHLTQTGWPFAIDGELRIVRVAARVRVNGLAMARHAALAGAGVAHLPEFAVADDVTGGRLVRVLEPFSPDAGGVNVIYPHSQLLAPKVSEFVALAVSRFRTVGAVGTLES